MRVEITTNHRLVVDVIVDGKVMAQAAMGQADTRDDLLRHVKAANAAKSLTRIVAGMADDLRRCVRLPDHINKSNAAMLHRWATGLVDGLDSVTMPHPLKNVPDIPPDSDPSYSRGYDCGEAIARAARIAQELRP